MPRTAGRPVVSTTIARVACTFDPRRRDEQSCSSRAGSSARRGGVRERCRSHQLHVFNRVLRESLGQTREGSDRVSTTRPQQSYSACPHPGLTTCRAAQRRGEHGSQQCERCVSRPCLSLLRLVVGVWPRCRELTEMLSDSVFHCNQPAHAAARENIPGCRPSAALAQPLLTRGGKPRGAS